MKGRGYLFEDVVMWIDCRKTTEIIIRFDGSLGIEWNLALSENKAGALSHNVWLKWHLTEKVKQSHYRPGQA